VEGQVPGSGPAHRELAERYGLAAKAPVGTSRPDLAHPNPLRPAEPDPPGIRPAKTSQGGVPVHVEDELAQHPGQLGGCRELVLRWPGGAVRSAKTTVLFS